METGALVLTQVNVRGREEGLGGLTYCDQDCSLRIQQPLFRYHVRNAKRDVCDSRPEIPYWWRKSLLNPDRSANWSTEQFCIISSMIIQCCDSVKWLKWVDKPTRLQRFVTLVHLPFSVRSLDLFCRFTCVYGGHFNVELSRSKVTASPKENIRGQICYPW